MTKTMKPTHSRTMKRHSKPTHSKMTLKYGGGKPKWYNPKTWKLPKLPKRRRVRKGDPSDLITSTASNEEFINAAGKANVRANEKTSPPKITRMPLPPPPPSQPIQPTLPRSGSIGSILESGSDSNIESSDGGYEKIGKAMESKIAELNKSEAAKLAQQQEVPQPTEQNNPTLIGMYVSAKNVRENRANQMKAAQMKMKTQMSPVFKQIRAMKPQTPTSNKSLMPTQISSEHIYDVLPPRETSPLRAAEEEEKLERLPTMAQAAKRNSLKKSKPNIAAKWEKMIAAQQKPPSPKTRKPHQIHSNVASIKNKMKLK